MVAWSAHQLFTAAEPVLGRESALHLRAYAQKLIRANLPVVLTLKHLSKITGVEYNCLRATVERRRETANYHMFAIKKRSGGRRFIHSASNQIFKTQQFINSEILQKINPHPSSYAFHASGGIRECAAAHCGARWLFQYDLSDFFYSINEKDVYSVFLNAGYRKLIAFELARICTTTRLPKSICHLLKPSTNAWISGQNWGKYEFYNKYGNSLGVLPQGAPTSPMLSNLVAYALDEQLTAFAEKNHLTYTRYADDLTFSSALDIPRGGSVGDIHRAIIGLIRKNGYKNNPQKTRIAGPGSKKIVLGLLVDGEKPRISKDTYKRIDRNLHAALKYGLPATSDHEGFDSPIGLYNHLQGLLAFVYDVAPEQWIELKKRFSAIPPP